MAVAWDREGLYHGQVWISAVSFVDLRYSWQGTGKDSKVWFGHDRAMAFAGLRREGRVRISCQCIHVQDVRLSRVC